MLDSGCSIPDARYLILSGGRLMADARYEPRIPPCFSTPLGGGEIGFDPASPEVTPRQVGFDWLCFGFVLALIGFVLALYWL